MERVSRTIAIACFTVGMIALLAVVPHFLPRPFLGLGNRREPPFQFWADSDRVGLTWYPDSTIRQPWAGQTNHLGFRYNVYTYGECDVSVPTWYLVIPAVAFGLGATVLAGRAARRALRGRCAECGYDMRATPERCPECGAVPRVAQASGL